MKKAKLCYSTYVCMLERMVVHCINVDVLQLRFVASDKISLLAQHSVEGGCKTQEGKQYLAAIPNWTYHPKTFYSFAFLRQFLQ